MNYISGYILEARQHQTEDAQGCLCWVVWTAHLYCKPSMNRNKCHFDVPTTNELVHATHEATGSVWCTVYTTLADQPFTVMPYLKCVPALRTQTLVRHCEGVFVHHFVPSLIRIIYLHIRSLFYVFGAF